MSTIKAFNSWITDKIEAKMRLKRPPVSLDILRKTLIKELPAALSTHRDEITKTRLYAELDAIFWEDRKDLLVHAVKAKYSSAKLHMVLKKQLGNRTVPPEWVVEAKFQDMKGRTSAPREETVNLPGILRVPFTDAPPYSLEETSHSKPFHALPKNKSDRFRIALISAPQLGLAYDPDIVRNLTRSGISAARKMRCDALVISGGLFRLTWQKTTGPNRLLDDLVTGTEIDIESMAANYRDRVAEILKKGEFGPIFTTAYERFKDLLRGWYKIMVRPDGRPEFDGPVYIVLSPDELGLVRRMAYFELLYLQNQELREAEAEANVRAKLAAEAHVYLTDTRHSGSKTAMNEAQRAYEEVEGESRDASRLVSRMRMTNLDPTQNRRVYDQALSYLIHEIEKHMPNTKVIDQNSAHVIFGKNASIIKFVSGGDSNNPYYDELGSYGPAQRKGNLPSLTVVSHPRSVYMRKTSRENYLSGSMLGTVGFVEAPMLIDKGPILDRTRGTRIKLPVVKAVADPMFNGGMLVIKIDSDLGITPDFISAEAVRKISAPRRGPSPAPADKLWLMVATDMHFGGSMRVFLHRPSGMPIGLTEAVFELMQKSGLSRGGATPVAGLFVCDDILHGNHFGTHMRPHYHWRSFAEILADNEQKLRRIRTIRDLKVREGEERKLYRELMDQVKSRPPDYLTGQFQELFHGLIRPYPDIFKGILLAAKRAKVVVRGVSDFSNVPNDMRDVGVINFGSGNHATKTTDGMLHEGAIVAEILRMRLAGDPDLAGLDLDRLIRWPLFQDLGIAYGTLKVGDGYEWGLHISGTPPKRDSWKDVLHGWVAVNRARGNPSSVLDEKSIVHITGDKHFFAGAFAGGDVYVMGPSSTHTDGFAEIAGGLAENNAGVAFIGLPAEGPDAGEISVVHLTPTTVQKYLTSGEPFPWDEFLPDSV
ncbi:MAG: hypothetical protein NUV60_03555 [Patescibacteria group bacterium]|nr:hypothetical protein [Patescibacteria group bacterium]